ncbi:hypothetical protein DRQ20_02920 [bacterium]|nr:MAG: hypothetical protein DRQ20_02920 [bacterium]
MNEEFSQRTSLSIPFQLNYQGFLVDKDGNPLTDTLTITFGIYDAMSGGSNLWLETHEVIVEGGYFNVILGKYNPIPFSLFNGETRWLEICVEGETLKPRTEIVSVGYAYFSYSSKQWNGHQWGEVYPKSDTANYCDSAMHAEKWDGHEWGEIYPLSDTSEYAKTWQGHIWGETYPKADTANYCDSATYAETWGGHTWGDLYPDADKLDGYEASDFALVGHNHDDRYYTQTQLSTAGQAQVHWDNITNKPLIGDVTGVNAGNGLEGGGESGEIYIDLDTTYTDSRYINDGEGAGGDLSGTYPNPTVAKIMGYPVSSTAPSAGQVLKWDGTQWAPASDENSGGDITSVNAGNGLTGGGTSGDVTLDVGAGTGISVSSDAVSLDLSYTDSRYINDGEGAGGDLSGTYPNPTVVRIQGRYVSSSSPSTGDVLKWDGSQWSPQPDATGANYWTLSSGTLYPNDPSWTVGIGTTSPSTSYKLDVRGPANFDANTSGAIVRIDQDGSGDALKISGAGDDGIYISNVSDEGIYIDSPGDHGVYVKNAGSVGIEVTSANIGVFAKSSNSIGICGEADNASYAGVRGDGKKIGVEGRSLYSYSSSSYGVYGYNNPGGNYDGKGVYGYCWPADNYGYGGYFSGGWFGVYARSYGYAVRGYNTNSGTAGILGWGDYGVYASGDLGASGTKSAIVRTSKGPREMYCIEATEVWFEDFGSGQLKDGRAYIKLDEDFLETVVIDEKHPLKVFITLLDECNGVYVKKDTEGFEVIELNGGRSNARFDYRVVAKRKGYENVRMKVVKEAYMDRFLYPDDNDPEIPPKYRAMRLRLKEEEEKNAETPIK